MRVLVFRLVRVWEPGQQEPLVRARGRAGAFYPPSPTGLAVHVVIGPFTGQSAGSRIMDLLPFVFVSSWSHAPRNA